MTMHFRALAEQTAADGIISPEDVLALRAASWGDGAIAPEEAEALFVVNDRIGSPTAEWSDYFVEALGEFVVNGLEPKGYVTQDQADWLMARMDHDGLVKSLTELELVVRIVEKATNVPQSLKDYAMSQVEQAVLTGEGPTRAGCLEKGNVNAAEAAILRRVIFAQASDRPAAASRHEAEMLFRLKDATLAADNAPEWKRLFVQGVGSYLSGYSSYEPLDIGKARELESFMNDSAPNLLGFAGRMARSRIETGLAETFRALFGTSSRDKAAEQLRAEAVDIEENTWLQGQIDGNDTVDEYDQALLEFLQDNAAS